MIPKGLRYVCDSESGILRKKRGRGFEYFSADGRKINEEEALERIKGLVIPPNWENVWICADGTGHLQATGVDQKGRKQYLYHQEYTEYRQKSKYRQLIQFGKTLPKIRKRINDDLKKEGWPKEKVLALIVKILDEYHFRIGNKQYEQKNETYGLTTLRRKHLEKEPGKLKIEYKGKSGKFREIHITDQRLRELIKETSELPGYELFRYIDDEGKSRNVDSQDVNEYIQEIAQEDFSAKDFRTWGGTITTLEVSDKARKVIEKNPRKKLETEIVRQVAERLGNTISTCRDYYIHPKVLETTLNKQVEDISEEIDEEIAYKNLLRKHEKKVLNIIS